MPVRRTSECQRSWEIAEQFANPRTMISFSAEIGATQILPSPVAVSLSLSGSPLAVQLTGDVDEVHELYEQMTNKEFVQGGITASSAKGNPITLTLTLNFSLRSAVAVMTNATPDLAEKVFDAIRRRFPQAEGPSNSELENKTLRLNELMKEAASLGTEAETSLKVIGETQATVASTLEELTKYTTVAGSIATEMNDLKVQAAAAASSAQEKSAKSSQHSIEARSAKDEALAARNSAQESSNKAGAVEAKVQQFYESIDAHRNLLTETVTNAKDEFDAYQNRTKIIVNENERLQKSIREQLLKASGGALFGAFEDRKQKIVGAKWRWALASGLAILAQVGAVVWLAFEAQKVGQVEGSFYSQPMFILKATIAIPILGLIIFCISQYNRERDFEELYAFKSALSFSLAPYLDLVKSLIVEDGTAEHTGFIIRTVGQVFENPLDGLKRSPKKKKDELSTKQLLDALTEILSKAK